MVDHCTLKMELSWTNYDQRLNQPSNQLSLAHKKFDV